MKARQLLNAAVLLLGLFCAEGAYAELQARWIGVTGIVLEDGETTLVFDPVFTRPGVLNWFGLKALTSESDTVIENLRFLRLKRASAVFVSHEHFDHVLDTAFVAHELGAKVYGGDSLQRVIHANEERYQWRTPFQGVVDRETVQFGKFKVHFYRRDHPAIFPLFNFHFLSGTVPEDFRFGFYQYREGEVWCYWIEHPEGNIYIDQGSHFFDGLMKENRSVDFMFAGVANKLSVEDFVENYVGRLHPKILIPLHFDLFFVKADREKTRFLPRVELDEIQSLIVRDYATTRFILPKFGEKLILK